MADRPGGTGHPPVPGPAADADAGVPHPEEAERPRRTAVARRRPQRGGPHPGGAGAVVRPSPAGGGRVHGAACRTGADRPVGARRPRLHGDPADRRRAARRARVGADVARGAGGAHAQGPVPGRVRGRSARPGGRGEPAADPGRAAASAEPPGRAARATPVPGRGVGGAAGAAARRAVPPAPHRDPGHRRARRRDGCRAGAHAGAGAVGQPGDRHRPGAAGAARGPGGLGAPAPGGTAGRGGRGGAAARGRRGAGERTVRLPVDGGDRRAVRRAAAGAAGGRVGPGARSRHTLAEDLGAYGPVGAVERALWLRYADQGDQARRLLRRLALAAGPVSAPRRRPRCWRRTSRRRTGC